MKTDRLIGILSILLQQEKTTAPRLAEKFEVSRQRSAGISMRFAGQGSPYVPPRGRAEALA